MGDKVTLEQAVFTDAKRPDTRGRWALLLGILMLQAVFYLVLRDVVYSELLYTFAQQTFNHLASASVDKIGRVEIDLQGDVTLHDAEAYTLRDGERRLFFRTKKLRLSLDGMPLRDETLHVMRVDLFEPEIWIRREFGGHWNVLWALDSSAPVPPPAPPPEKEPDPWEVARSADFPLNGVHIHDGTINVTLVSRSGKEVVWTIREVRAVLAKTDGVLRLKPFEGEFYGGRITADADVLKTNPFTMSQMSVDIRDADVERMAAGVGFIRHRMTGTLNGVLAMTVDPERTNRRPVAAGRMEITDGDLWPLPAFSGIVHLLALTPVSAKRIDSAVLEFTVEEEQIRIDKMYFLGHPVSLFGDGTCSVTGDWIDVEFIPTLGKKTWNDILPVIGAPIDLLANILKGAIVPVTLTGSFEKPVFKVGEEEAGYTPKPSVQKLIKEKGPE